jgi:peptide chain release factor 1
MKNKEKALKVLRSRVYDIELAKHNKEVGDIRKTMVGGGDRSDKIRTYNYPQGRVTDHRIGMDIFNLPSVMDGEIYKFIEELRLVENAERLKEGTV